MSHRFTALALVASLAAVGCTHTTKEIHHRRDRSAERRRPRGAPVVLQRYQVPPRSAPAIRDLLRQLFATSKGRPAVARVAVSPDGSLAVAAPEHVQTGVADLIAKMKSLPDAPASVAVTYWIVEAVPAATARVDPALGEIEASLLAFTAKQGPLDFSAVERVTLRSAEDVTASHQGRRAEVRQTIFAADDDHLTAELSLQHHGHQGSELRTRVELEQDAPVVVGEMDLGPTEAGPRARRLFVVRARAERPPSSQPNG